MNTTGSNSYASISQFRDSTFGIYKSANWFSDVSSSALAITQFYGYVRSDASLGTYVDLTHADIIMNYRDYGTMFGTTNSAAYDIPTVVLHEMGHFLGLCHERYTGIPLSVMEPYYDPSSIHRNLLPNDKTKITNLYINNTVSAMLARTSANAITAPAGTPIRGIVELRADGRCLHYINDKLVYEHHK
jgi:hypothetical protein